MAKTTLHRGELQDFLDYNRAELKDQGERVAQMLEAKVFPGRNKAILNRIETLRKINAVVNRIAEDIHNDIRRNG